jgi:hypothetical protein
MCQKNLDCEQWDPVIYNIWYKTNKSAMLKFNMDPTYESTIGPGVIHQTLILLMFMHWSTWFLLYLWGAKT